MAGRRSGLPMLHWNRPRPAGSSRSNGMRDIGVGIIGTGFMGKAHSFAYRAVAGIFPGSLRPVLQCVADINGRAAEQAAKQFGFLRWRTDWRTLVEDPDIEIVSIPTPNVVHREMALAAIAAGKDVH